MRLVRDRGRAAETGQVLVIVALTITLLLAFAGFAIDIGRQVAERRHVQTAADAAALAACRALMTGASNDSAAAQARAIANANLGDSPANATPSIAADDARVYDDGHSGDPAYLRSGIFISGTDVRVAIHSELDALLARVVGIDTLETGARAHCQLKGGPALPIVAKRYADPPGPGGNFVDALATEASSTTGAVDTFSVLGYGGRTPASEAQPGPAFDFYGIGSKANNDKSFRGFVVLDIRNFQSETSRVYYDGVTDGTTQNTLKNMNGDYILNGYTGPMFPPITNPADPNDQVGTMSGNDTAMVVHAFEQVYAVGDRVLLAVYDGTVMAIPDFSIVPPSAIELPSTTSSPTGGPTFTVARNASFSSTVTLHLHGDHLTANPAYDLIPVDPPTNDPPAAGLMNQPAWSTDVFTPAKQGTQVQMLSMSTNAVPAGIYTVWLEGHSGNPYFQARRYPTVVKIGGAVRDFSFENSNVLAQIGSVGGSITSPIYVSTTSASATKWGNTGSNVGLSVDYGSFTDCSYGAATIGAGQLTLSAGSVSPTSSGNGALSTLSINSFGLAPGCYTFVVRGTGTNGDGQPVTHLHQVQFTVAATGSGGSYVDIIGFAVFQVSDIGPNGLTARAVSAIYADPNDAALRRAQKPRLVPW